MKILVKGAAGFIENQTVAELSRRGHDIVATDKISGGGIMQTDITDLKGVISLLEQTKPEAVVHLAAAGGTTGKNEIEQSLRQVRLNYLVNVMGTANVCEACRLVGTSRIVYMSTFAVFGRTDAERLPITSETPVRLEYAYSSSKYAGELVFKNYSPDFGIRSAIFRTPFVAGGRPGKKKCGTGIH